MLQCGDDYMCFCSTDPLAPIKSQYQSCFDVEFSSVFTITHCLQRNQLGRNNYVYISRVKDTNFIEKIQNMYSCEQ